MKGYEHLKWSSNPDDVDRYLRIKEGEQREMQRTAAIISVLVLIAAGIHVVVWLASLL